MTTISGMIVKTILIASISAKGIETIVSST
jgi:hypothetical protein